MSLGPANAMEKDQAKTSSVRKERGHSNGPNKKAPKGPISEQLVHTQRPTSP
ncbi:hypothetical protein ACVWY0_003939 [Arthrobacter sp. UYNi723]